jgi:hypothetical protein
VYVFVDISNVDQLVRLHAVSGGAGSGATKVKMAVCPVRLARYVVDGRTLEKAMAVGSATATLAARQKARWNASGFDTLIQIRAPGAGEQFVDEAIIANVSDTLQSHGSCTAPGATKRTLVLLTGDGNDNGGRASFFRQVQFAIAAGWNVELRCWCKNVSSRYTELADRGQIRLIPLDGGAPAFCQPISDASVGAGAGTDVGAASASGGLPGAGITGAAAGGRVVAWTDDSADLHSTIHIVQDSTSTPTSAQSRVTARTNERVRVPTPLPESESELTKKALLPLSGSKPPTQPK